MKDFSYPTPKTIKEAVSLLAELKGEGKIMCGGQSILVLMKQNMLTPEYTVDIEGISELDYIKYSEKEGLRIGALATHRAVEKSAVVRDKYPVLA